MSDGLDHLVRFYRILETLEGKIGGRPFDLRHHRVLKYLPNVEGLASMQATLAERLKTLSRRTTSCS